MWECVEARECFGLPSNGSHLLPPSTLHFALLSLASLLPPPCALTTARRLSEDVTITVARSDTAVTAPTSTLP